MQTEEQECSSIQLSIRVIERGLPGNDALLQPQPSRAEGDAGTDGSSFLLEQNVARPSFAERCPRLTIFAVTACIFLAAITAEVGYLQASGYYWHW